MKLIFVIFLYALLSSVILGQTSENEIKPLSLIIEPINQNVCPDESLNLKVELLNTSNEDLVIDTNNVGHGQSFSVLRIKNNRVTSSYYDEIGDPSPYYEGKYYLLKPNESYQTIHSISLKGEYFDTKGEYQVNINYGQFLNKTFSEKAVWRGSVKSNTVTFTINKCQKLKVKK
jgi:hypothetical protein